MAIRFRREPIFYKCASNTMIKQNETEDPIEW